MPSGPLAPPQPVFQAPLVVLLAIAGLAAIHFALWLGGEAWQTWALYMFAFIPARLGGGEVVPFVAGAQFWSFLTYSFLHADITHLLFNCLWLLIFGTVAARYLGALRFLVLSAVSSVAGALAMLLTHWGEGSIMIGASGAVSGLMAAAIPVMYGRRRLAARIGEAGQAFHLSPSEFIRDRNAIIFTVVFLVITLFSGATGWIGNGFLEGASIAWEDHLGGFGAGLAAFYAVAPRSRAQALPM